MLIPLQQETIKSKFGTCESLVCFFLVWNIFRKEFSYSFLWDLHQKLDATSNTWFTSCIIPLHAIWPFCLIPCNFESWWLLGRLSVSQSKIKALLIHSTEISTRPSFTLVYTTYAIWPLGEGKPNRLSDSGYSCLMTITVSLWYVYQIMFNHIAYRWDRNHWLPSGKVRTSLEKEEGSTPYPDLKGKCWLGIKGKDWGCHLHGWSAVRLMGSSGPAFVQGSCQIYAYICKEGIIQRSGHHVLDD